jgi:uncharacterized membrane protein YkoI
MNRVFVRITCIAASVLLAGAAFLPMDTAVADDVSAETARRLNREGAILALDDILEQVRERYPAARLLEAELERDDGRYVYEMEILTREGQVRELEVDAADATILEDEEED